MKDRDVYAGLTLVMFSVFGIYISAILPNTSTTTLSSGFFPGFLFVSLGLCGLGLIYQGSKKKEKTPLPSVNWKMVIPILVLAVLYAFTLKPLGFRISTMSFVLLAMLILGERKPLFLIAIPIVSSLSVYYLFAKVFLIALP